MKHKLICNNKTKMAQVINTFITGKGRKKTFGNFKITQDSITYECQQKNIASFFYYKGDKPGEGRALRLLDKLLARHPGLRKLYKNEICEFMDNGTCPEMEYITTNVDVIAVRTEAGEIIGNSDILQNIGAYSVYGNKQYNNTQTLIQQLLSKQVKMLPFLKFEEYGLDIKTLKILAQGADGELLLTANNKTFLFNTNHAKIKNYFYSCLFKMPSEVKTIAKAKKEREATKLSIYGQPKRKAM